MGMEGAIVLLKLAVWATLYPCALPGTVFIVSFLWNCYYQLLYIVAEKRAVGPLVVQISVSIIGGNLFGKNSSNGNNQRCSLKSKLPWKALKNWQDSKELSRHVIKQNGNLGASKSQSHFCPEGIFPLDKLELCL